MADPAVRYVAAARRPYVGACIAEEDATVCGSDLADDTELWQDIPPDQVTQVCPECAGTTEQEALL